MTDTEQVVAAPEPLLPAKLQARAQKGTAEFLEPGETVQLWIPNMTMPAVVYISMVGLLILPYVIQHASSVIVTDRNVYVMKNGLSGFKPKRVLFKAPLGTVPAKVDGSGFPGRYLMIAEHKIWLPLSGATLRRAHAAAAAASGA